METFSALLAICAGNSPHKGQWRGALMFSLICAWINRWVNNREAGNVRRHRAHYDVALMFAPTKPWWRHNMDTRNGLTELSNAELPHPEQTIEQTAELQVISDVKSHDAHVTLLLCSSMDQQEKLLKSGNLETDYKGTIYIYIYIYIQMAEIPVFKIRTIGYARDLWKLARSCKQLHLLCPSDPWNLPGTALLGRLGFEIHRVRQDLVYVVSFGVKDLRVNIWNNRKAEE